MRGAERMNRLKNFLKKDKQMIRISAAVFLLFVLVLVFICLAYYSLLRDTVSSETRDYLTETSAQTESGITRIINDNFRRTGAIDSILKNAVNVSTFAGIGKMLGTLKENWGYNDITIVASEDDYMHSYHSSQDGDRGTSIAHIPNDSPLKNLTEAQKLYIDQDTQGIQRVNFARVIEPVEVEGKKVNIISLSYSLDTFYTVIDTKLYEGKAYTHIINKDGTLLVQGTKENVDKWGANFLTSLIGDEESEASVKMLSDIAEDKAGIVVLDFNDAERYVSYRPVTGAEDWYMVTVVPASVLNYKTEVLMQLTIVFCIFVIAVMVLLLILLLISFYKSRKKYESFAFVDPVTGGATLQKFYIDAAESLKKSNGKKAVVYTNIEKFKVTNEQYGMETGNALLKGMSTGIRSCLAEDESLGRIMADHFAILLNYYNEEKLVERFHNWHGAIMTELTNRDVSMFFPTLQLGVYVVDEENMSLPFMLDRAKLAMNEKTNILNNKMSYSLYDENAHIRLLREKQLEDCMDKALAEGQFEVYFQPKYNTVTKKIGSAEALSRWSGHAYGMVYPDEFIPLFEKNGFIIQLDLWVFREVCKLIRRWMDEGKEPVPISVNCSRRNLKHPHFIDNYVKILNQYDIPARYIEIELTESILYEDAEALVAMIDELHNIGFTCSIDDFGSGYSSLSMIQGIPVDVLKLDKIFFKNSLVDNRRGVSVIEAIIRMAKSLQMKTVAEGVELSEQVRMLEEVGCDFIQGFIFSKPVPLGDFEKLAFPDDAQDMKKENRN